MSETKAQRMEGKAKPWWRYRRNRNKVWFAVIVLGMGVIAGLFWLGYRNMQVGEEGPVPIGQPVRAVALEDSRTGQMFALGQYLGKRDVVIVAYMGGFCLGCRELVAELERRVPDFEAADAYVVGLGYEIGQTGANTVANNGIKSYPLLQEGPPYKFIRSLGMWSDHMQMPFMGYVVIDKSGRIVAGEPVGLSEAKGAGPANVDHILTALKETRQ